MSILKLQASYKDYIWGGERLKSEYNKKHDKDILAESWELSCHADGHSYILNGEHKDKTLQAYIDEVGKEVLGTSAQSFDNFPLLVKFIDAKKRLSVQVHPNNAYALEHEGQYGKSEMWYICDCDEDSYIYYGFSKEIDEKEIKCRIKNNTLLDVLNAVKVKKGEVYFIEAGTVHAIGKNIIIAEIQQNSNITYRLYDYGRLDANGNTRELHIEKALEVVDKKAIKPYVYAENHLVKCTYFTVDKISLNNENTKLWQAEQSEKSFIHFLIVEGSGKICMENEELYFEKGNSFFMPAGKEKYFIEGSCDILMTRLSEPV